MVRKNTLKVKELKKFLEDKEDNSTLEYYDRDINNYYPLNLKEIKIIL